jgi:FixJ family two-component response regulator
MSVSSLALELSPAEAGERAAAVAFFERALQISHMRAPSGTLEPLAPLPAAILLVDDDQDLRETVRDLLSSLGIAECLTAGSLAELEAQRTAALACSLAIVDLNLGASAASGIDVYHWLERARFAGKVVFLTGYGADNPLVREAARVGEARTLSKPIAVTELIALAAEAHGSG